MRKTKIVCTLGPSTDDEAVLRELILSGMNVARLNMSHGTHEEHKRRADMVKKLRKELDVPVAILLDTKGPEIRTGKFAEKVMLTHGQKYTLTTNERPGDAEGCSITFKDLPKDVHRGSHILIDDGLIEMVVEKVTDTDIECRLLNDGPITSYKGINVPGVTLSMPYISEKDRADLEFCVKEDFEFIAASFTRSAEDIVMIRNELEKNNCRDIRIIAKIENTDGVENIDDIIRVSDGIMVARGDLGVEIPMEEIPVLQKQLIHKAYVAGKQVITATQMLDSMIKNPRPTRAEATDVANAIYDGTSAIMLSGETAAGAYPVEAVRTMGPHCGAHRKRHRLRASVGAVGCAGAKGRDLCHFARDVHDGARPRRGGHHDRIENRLYGAHDFEIPPGVPNHQRHDRPQGTEPDGPFLGRNPRDAGGKDQHRRAV